MGTFEVGDVIAGKYEVTRVLGKGGMGLVVAALHRELDELVAIKVLLPTLQQNAESCARFSREARTAIRIKSDHVVKVHDVGAVDGVPFLVMEYLNGEDLSRVIRQRGPLPVGETVDLLLQACEAIADAHNLGIVHRDLKPANLFLTRRSEGTPFVKVLDFGISKSTAMNDVSVTASAAVVGSPLYMSPEQLGSGRVADPRSDIWSLGVILYEMLTGATPFAGESFAELCAAIYRGTYTPLSVRRPDVPEPLEKTLSEMLVRDPEGRLASVEAFAARIAPFGSDAARASYEVIRRMATRPPPPVLPAPRHQEEESGVPLRLRSHLPEIPAPVQTVTRAPLSESLIAPVRPPRRRRRAAAAVATAVVGLFVTTVFLSRSGTSATWATSVSRALGMAPTCDPDADTGNACYQCRDKNCCAEYLACHESKACGDYLDCQSACPTRACRLACTQKYREGQAIAAPYVACATSHCSGPCGGAAKDCVYCQESSCAKEVSDCSSDPACNTLHTCAAACGGDQLCIQACKSGASSGTQALYDALISCGHNYCAKACR